MSSEKAKRLGTPAKHKTHARAPFQRTPVPNRRKGARERGPRTMMSPRSQRYRADDANMERFSASTSLIATFGRQDSQSSGQRRPAAVTIARRGRTSLP